MCSTGDNRISSSEGMHRVWSTGRQKIQLKSRQEMAVEQQCEIMERKMTIRLRVSFNIQAFHHILEMYFAECVQIKLCAPQAAWTSPCVFAHSPAVGACPSLHQVRAAARSERKTETGVDADRRTDSRSPGKAGPSSAGPDSEVLFCIFSEPHSFMHLFQELKKKKKTQCSCVTVLFPFSSLVVDKQPPQVIKTQSKFSTTVRYLLGEKVAPGKPVVLKAHIINELQARNLGSLPR